MNKNRRRGKNYERWLAQDNQGRRVGILAQEDVDMPGISAECKERQAMPAFIARCMAQAKANARQDKLPAVFLHILNTNHNDDVVMMRYCDFKVIYDGWRRKRE
jgi:hypothetical protein